MYDVDRKVRTPLRELYFYPMWDDLPDIREKLRPEKNRIWRKPSIKQKTMNGIKDFYGQYMLESVKQESNERTNTDIVFNVQSE